MNNFWVIALVFGYALAYQPADLEATSDREAYIINGNQASDGEYPYMLSLRLNGSHICGASVLTKDWALTSASCCTRGQSGLQMSLYSGSVNLNSGGTDHSIKSMKTHEDYNATRFWINNICLVKVSNAFRFSTKVQQVTLPIQNSPVNDGELVTVTGWGYTKSDERVMSEYLQVGKNHVTLSAEKCRRYTGLDHESYLCAMGNKNVEGICYGDGGSPLVRNGVQVGIASWFYHPCATGSPDFYTRVPIFIDWIKKNLGKDASKLKFGQ